MILISRAWPRRLAGAARTGLLCLAGALAVSACSSNYNLGITPSLGIAMNVALTTSSGTTQLVQGNSVIVFATVANDTSNAGVTWSLNGPGQLENPTPTQVTYVAPASGVVGAVGALVTATSVASAADNAAVTLVTFGSPVIPLQPAFPANVGVAYELDVSVVGGVAPYAWSVASGSTLPPGLSLGASTSTVEPINGTPTTAGVYSFEVQVKDSQGSVATQTFSLPVSPATACLLVGRYAFSFTGFRGGVAATHTGVLDISSTGAITGEQDYKDGVRTTLDETLNATSKCTNRSTNTGVLELDSPSGTLSYDFAVTAPDTSGVIHSARLQIIGNPGTKTVFVDAGSGEMHLVDASANTGAAPAGNFAFGLLGVDGSGAHYGTAGAFAATAGTLSGTVDSNGGAGAALGAGVTDAALSGTISAPDTYGRGTVSLQAGATSTTLIYYLVNADRMLLMNADATVNSARESGYLTRQTGNVSASSFDASALAGPAVLSLWGLHGTINPVTSVALGQLSGANPTAGTVNAILDSAVQGTDTAGESYSAQSYSVEASGRGTLTLTGTSGTRSLVFYLDGPSDGYVVQPGSPSGDAGLLEAQTIPTGGFSSVLSGEFVADTQYPQTQGPVTLLPLVQLSYGSLSSNYATGTFAINPVNGRGFGTLNIPGVGETAAVLYIVSPTKVDLMNFATPQGTNGSISWLIQN